MAEAPAIERTGFFRVYDAVDGAVMNVAPYDAVVTTPTVLATSLPDGSVLMNGYEGMDVIFGGTDTDNDDFNFEIWYYYLVASPTAPPSEWMWLPKLVISSATAGNANQLGTFVGVNGTYVESKIKFADTIGALTASAHQTDLINFNAEASVWIVDTDAANGVASVMCRNCAGAHAVRIHPFEDGTAGNAITIQPFARLTRGLAHA